MRRLLGIAATAALLVGGAAVTTTAAVTTRSVPAHALDNGLARTPPMGFNDWNSFGCNVDEQLIKQTADLFVSTGLKDAGYEYVNIDDCWQLKHRSADGHLVPDPEKFPDGISGTADYVHSKGLKLGIYSSAGATTCAGYPASYKHEKVDAQDFADWGVDYLKYDNCGDRDAPETKEGYIERYSRMRDALAATGRPIVYSLCEWGNKDVPSWGAEVGNLWRTTGDIRDNWSSLKSIIRQNMVSYAAAGPGGWNDPDMLEVGNGGMTATEYRTHFGLWAMMASPLLIGTDLREATPATMKILLNKEVIAIDQDRLGRQAKPISDSNGHVVFAKKLSGGDVAVALYNESDTAATIGTTTGAVGVRHAAAYTLRDVWQHTTTETAGRISANVPAHGTVMYRVSRDHRWAKYPPASTLSIDPQTSYDGQPVNLVTPGEASAVTTTFRNLGRVPVRSTSVRLGAPDDWQVTRSGGHGHGHHAADRHGSGHVGSGDSMSQRWSVTPPDGVTPGTYELTATASYRWNGHHRATVDASVTVVVPRQAPDGTQYLSDVPWLSATNGYGPVERDSSVGGKSAGDGDTITINGTTYDKGLGTNAPSEIVYYVGGNCSSVSTDVGIDDEKNVAVASASFQIWADDQKVADSGVLTASDDARHLTADLDGAQFVRLVADDDGDPNSDHTDWAGAKLVCNPPQPLHGTHYVSDLNWQSADGYWGPVERDMSNGEKAGNDGRTITIGGTAYDKGIGTNAPSKVVLHTGGTCSSITTDVGVDDEVGDDGDVVFQIYADGTKVADSGALTGADAAKSLTADVRGADDVSLVVDPHGATTYDHADWAGIQVHCS